MTLAAPGVTEPCEAVTALDAPAATSRRDATRRDPTRRDLTGRDADRCAVGLVVVFAALAVAVGLHAGTRTMDVDEAVFLRTLTAMHHGAGYYDAMRRALVMKEGTAPSQLRSIRPPTMFVLLAPLPPWSWRWVVGVVDAAVLAMVWRLARSVRAWGGPVAVVLAGLWMVGAAPMLYLHAELWGLPFALAGVVAARRERWAMAAVGIGIAVAFRELYAGLFVLSLLVAPRRRPWLIVGAGLAGFAAAHAALASSALTVHGHEPALGSGARTLRYALSCLSPSDRPLGWIVGVATTVAGVTVLASLVRRRLATIDTAVVVFVVVMIVLTVTLGRVYWGLTTGPLLACYAPGAWPLLRRLRRPAPRAVPAPLRA